jgi:hypothetical protein
MTSTWWTTRKFVWLGAAATLTGTAAFLSVAIAYQKPISNAALGAEWQCTRTAFIWTSCSRIGRTETDAVVQSVRKDKDLPCPPSRGLNG